MPGVVVVDSITSVDWGSLTFADERHRIALRLASLLPNAKWVTVTVTSPLPTFGT